MASAVKMGTSYTSRHNCCTELQPLTDRLGKGSLKDVNALICCIGSALTLTFIAGFILARSERSTSSFDLFLAAMAHLRLDFPCRCVAQYIVILMSIDDASNNEQIEGMFV